MLRLVGPNHGPQSIRINEAVPQFKSELNAKRSVASSVCHAPGRSSGAGALASEQALLVPAFGRLGLVPETSSSRNIGRPPEKIGA
jgi:hypothetical protein